MKGDGEVEFILKLETVLEVREQTHPKAALPQGIESPRVHLIECWVGLIARWNLQRREKSLSSHWERIIGLFVFSPRGIVTNIGTKFLRAGPSIL
jgi:hypothetical protein